MANEHWRWAVVRRLGTVSIKTMQCGCGRRVEPRDFEVLNSGALRVVCPSCHADVFRVEQRPNRDAP